MSDDVPTKVDLQRFWLLEKPLDLSSPFHRDTLHCWIQESIDRSCDWIDVAKRRREREPVNQTEYLMLLAEAHKLLAYKRACMALLATLEEKPPAPKDLMRERYVAAWALKQSLR